MKKVLILLGVCLFVLCSESIRADIPKLINYQGMLTESDGTTPVADGTYNLGFKIYGSESGTDSLWREYHSNVEVTNGLFNVILGSQSALNLLFDADYWLEIIIGTEIMPTRLRFTSVGYAYRALVADSAGVAGAGGGGGGWVDDGTVVRLESGGDSVGIGTTDPDYNLDVRSSGTAIYGRTTGGPWNMGLYGRAEVDGFGVLGSSTSGHAVHGVTASGYAGYFEGPKNYFSGEVGIGTTDPDEMVEIHGSEAGQRAFLELETSHASEFQETGIRFRTPAHTWHFRMDGYDHNNLPDTGSLALRSQTAGEVMIWTPDGNVGIGTSDPSTKLEVNGDVKATGDLEVASAYKGNITSSSGTDGAPFPRPAYDSDWQAINQSQALTLTHSIGGDPDNYVVDLQFYNSSSGRNQQSYGRDEDELGNDRGTEWRSLTNSQITVFRWPNDTAADSIRVRIWVYK